MPKKTKHCYAKYNEFFRQKLSPYEPAKLTVWQVLPCERRRCQGVHEDQAALCLVVSCRVGEWIGVKNLLPVFDTLGQIEKWDQQREEGKFPGPL
eukprot:751120-Hanusia_phi.AAC.1